MTNDQIITKIKQWGAVPGNQPAFTDSQFLDIVEDELLSNIVPILMSFSEEFFVTYSDTAITSSKSSYEIPSEAIGSKLREVKMVDGDTVINVPRLEPNHFEDYTFGFYIQDNSLILVNPENYTNYNLRMYYFFRPNHLILSTDTTYGSATITNINTSTKEITVDSLPSWSTATEIDYIKGKSPYTIYKAGVGITNVSSNTITVSSLHDNLSVGDYVAYTDYSPVPNVPEILHYMLIQSALMKIFEALGDETSLKMASMKYKQYFQNIRTLISPRVKGEVKKIVNHESLLGN